MNVLRPEKQVAMIAALVEAVSIRSIERMTGIPRYDHAAPRSTGGNCATILDQAMRNLRCQRIQVDELWTFVQKKQARLLYEERFSAEMGDQYVFVFMGAFA